MHYMQLLSFPTHSFVYVRIGLPFVLIVLPMYCPRTCIEACVWVWGLWEGICMDLYLGNCVYVDLIICCGIHNKLFKLSIYLAKNQMNYYYHRSCAISLTLLPCTAATST